MPHLTEFAIWMALLIGVAILVAVAAVGMLRKRIFREEEYDEEDDSVYTTARLEDLKSQGLVDEAQYARLKVEALEAGKRRAAAARRRERKKSALFD